MIEQNDYPLAEDLASFLSDLLGATPEITMNDNENRNAYLLVSFVFGNSKTNGIIMGVRYELPNKVKESKDFSGTFYKEVTDGHGQRKIYRYVPLADAIDFLDDTDTSSKILDKVLTVEQIELVNAPLAGEVWVDEDGNTYLVLENGYWAAPNGTIHCPQCDAHLENAERQARAITALA